MPRSTLKANRPPRRGQGRRPPRGDRRAPLAATPGPDPGTPLDQVRLAVGTIVGAHGVHGEIKLRVETDEPDHLPAIRRVFVGDETSPRPLRGVRFHGGQALLRISGIDTPEAVDALRGTVVRIAGSDARPPADGEFFLYQLIGLTAVDEAGTSLGQVTDLLPTGANDVFVVTPEGGGPDLLLPHHPEVVLAIEPERGQMVVRPLVYQD